MRKKLFSELPHKKSERLVLKKLEDADAPDLQTLVESPAVYRYLPTFLFEKKYGDVHEVIRRLYTECFRESIILGVCIAARVMRDTRQEENSAYVQARSGVFFFPRC